MPKCDFNKVALLLRHGCSPVNFLHIFRTHFPMNELGGCFWLFKQDKFFPSNCPSFVFKQYKTYKLKLSSVDFLNSANEVCHLYF